MMLLLSIAFADARQDLENALMARSLGERDVAQNALIRLTRSLAADDPLRGLALFWSATLSAELGQPDAARETLRDCIRNGPAREDCADLLGRLELEQSAMRVPTRWNFSAEHGMVHLWSQSDQGAVRVEPVGSDPALIWESRQLPDQAGMLLFAVDSAVTPKRLSMRLSTPEERAVLLPLFMDEFGAVHRAKQPIVLTQERPRSVSIELADVPGLDPRRLERVVLRDLTAADDTASGKTVVVLDDVSLR